MSDHLKDNPSQQAQSLILEHIRRRRQGCSVSDQELVDSHPHLREELLRALENARALSLAFAAAGAEPSVRGPSEWSINCPACHAPLAAADTVADGVTIESVCGSCGRHVVVRQEPNVDRVAHFELIDRLGTGGFGTVWRALDTKLDREVALKIARRDASATVDEDAFVREAKAAAKLKHPNIVATYEVGRDGDTAYIASELIEGMSLKVYLAEQPFTMTDAADICRTIAEAVHCAHEEGVIHRDLKPLNILLGCDGQPHVADFGLARRVENEITVTLDGQVVGTPAYMSPEQAAGDSHSSDRRSDVYALGVLLFEMLTGELPFRGSMPVLIQQVIVADPPHPRNLQPRIPRDLETICLKCLEKRPDRRYQTAQALANDLQRFLDKKPIVARPVGRLGHAIRWCQRFPTRAALFGLIATIAVVAPLVAVHQMGLTQRAEKLADQERVARENTETVVDAMVTALASPDPARDGILITVAEVLDHAMETANSDLADQPYAQAKLLTAIGRSFDGLGLPHRSLNAAMEVDKLYAQHAVGSARERINARAELAMALKDSGQIDKAVEILEPTVEQMRVQLPENDEDTLARMYHLAILYRKQERYDEALPLIEETKRRMVEALGAEHEYTLSAMNSLANTYRALERYEESIAEHEKTLSMRERLFGDAHPNTMTSMNNLALTYNVAGYRDKAAPMLERTLTLRRKFLGDDHFNTLNCLTNLGCCYSDMGDYEKGLPLQIEALERRRRVLGVNHPDVANSLENLAITYYRMGRIQDAIQTREEELRIYDESADWNPRYIMALSAMGKYYTESDRADEGLEMLKRAWSISREKMGDTHIQSAIAARTLALALKHAKRYPEALDVYVGVVGDLETLLGTRNSKTLQATLETAETYAAMDRNEEALPLAKKALAGFEARQEPDQTFSFKAQELIDQIEAALADR